MFDRLDAVDVEGVVRFIASLQQEDGSFFGKYLCQYYYIIITYHYNKLKKKRD